MAIFTITMTMTVNKLNSPNNGGDDFTGSGEVIYSSVTDW